MPTKKQIKTIRSYKHKKNRQADGVFVAEGDKLVRHFLKLGLKPKWLFCVDDRLAGRDAEQISQAEMKAVSLLQHPSPALAVFYQPTFNEQRAEAPFILVLDGVRDPGNMGTILRLCDWFGVNRVFCTDDCVDVYNEKVVQASMGSVAVVQAESKPRELLLNDLESAGFTLLGTDMQAESIYTCQFPEKTALVLGNEGQGMTDFFRERCTKLVRIPGSDQAKAESLNVASTAAICLSEMSRTA